MVIYCISIPQLLKAENSDKSKKELLFWTS